MITLTVNLTLISLMTDEISEDSRVVKNKKHAGVVYTLVMIKICFYRFPLASLFLVPTFSSGMINYVRQAKTSKNM